MRTLRGDKADELLKIDEHLLQRLRDMSSRAATPDEMIGLLQVEGLPKPGAIIALRRAGVMDSNEAKRAVHFSDAYADRRRADEVFEESVVQASRDLDASEAA